MADNDQYPLDKPDQDQSEPTQQTVESERTKKQGKQKNSSDEDSDEEPFPVISERDSVDEGIPQIPLNPGPRVILKPIKPKRVPQSAPLPPILRQYPPHLFPRMDLPPIPPPIPVPEDEDEEEDVEGDEDEKAKKKEKVDISPMNYDSFNAFVLELSELLDDIKAPHKRQAIRELHRKAKSADTIATFFDQDPPKALRLVSFPQLSSSQLLSDTGRIGALLMKTYTLPRNPTQIAEVCYHDKSDKLAVDVAEDVVNKIFSFKKDVEPNNNRINNRDIPTVVQVITARQVNMNTNARIQMKLWAAAHHNIREFGIIRPVFGLVCGSNDGYQYWCYERGVFSCQFADNECLDGKITAVPRLFYFFLFAFLSGQPYYKCGEMLSTMQKLESDGPPDTWEMVIEEFQYEASEYDKVVGAVEFDRTWPTQEERHDFSESGMDSDDDDDDVENAPVPDLVADNSNDDEPDY